MFPVKICGISNRESLDIVLKHPVSAVGFIFYPQSPRYIEPDEAKTLTILIPDKISTVGVFVNETADNIESISKQLNLDFIQLHGDESPEFCSKLSKPVIKAIRVGSEFQSDALAAFDIAAFLLDTYQPGLFGGTGETFNWELLQNLKIDTPVILSGGLNPDNVQDCIQKTNPAAIDVNSGVETCPGQKDERKLKSLFEILENENCNTNIFLKKEIV